MGDASEQLREIRTRGLAGRFAGYAGMTGPGWLQSAVTLGGGSLASALYLGIIAGYSLLWLQPLAMLCGVVMLMALAHVTLGESDPPFESVKRRISPVLAWGWLGATVVADVVFCTAQSALGVATVQQNLGMASLSPFVITIVLSAVAFAAAILYALGSRAGRRLELILKLLVAMVLISFACAATVLLIRGRFDLGAVAAGLIPDPRSLFRPAASLQPLIDATGEAAGYWTSVIADAQRSRIIAAFGTAVGINMTFLLPYTLLKRGWTREHRELSRFDLVMALFLPYSIATALLVLSSAAAFHASDADVLDADGRPVASLEAGYYKTLGTRLAAAGEAPGDPAALRAAADALPESERRLAAAITNRDAKQLAGTLAPLMGGGAANLVFGVGILAMAVSTMIVHMLMNGFAISQAFGCPGRIGPFAAGAAMPALLAVFSPLVWAGDAKAALQIPAAVIATLFLPIAYLAILLLINSPTRAGDGKRPGTAANLAMATATAIATFASVWLLAGKGGAGLAGIGALLVVAATGIAGFLKRRTAASAAAGLQ